MEIIRKFLSVLLTFLILALPSSLNSHAQETETIEDIKSNVKKVTPVLKLVAKFSVPIAVLAAIGGGSAVAYYKYRNPTITLKGEVTSKEIDELLKDVDKLDLKGKELTIKFENAVIKPGTFHDKTFNHRVLFCGNCAIEPNACKSTTFKSDFEVKGSFSKNSSLEGARFESSVIVNTTIPKKLFFGSHVILNKGNKYRLPERIEVICDGTDKSKLCVKNYLEEVYFK